MAKGSRVQTLLLGDEAVCPRSLLTHRPLGDLYPGLLKSWFTVLYFQGQALICHAARSSVYLQLQIKWPRLSLAGRVHSGDTTESQKSQRHCPYRPGSQAAVTRLQGARGSPRATAHRLAARAGAADAEHAPEGAGARGRRPLSWRERRVCQAGERDEKRNSMCLGNGQFLPQSLHEQFLVCSGVCFVPSPLPDTAGGPQNQPRLLPPRTSGRRQSNAGHGQGPVGRRQARGRWQSCQKENARSRDVCTETEDGGGNIPGNRAAKQRLESIKLPTKRKKP